MGTFSDAHATSIAVDLQVARFHARIVRMFDLLKYPPRIFQLGFLILCAGGLLLFVGCSGANQQSQVVVYTSVDDVYSRDIAERFEKRSGVRVLLVTDTEETKSTGLVNRLMAEKERPQADVFWSGDPVRAALLKQRKVTTPYLSAAASPKQLAMGDQQNHFTGLSARLRVLIYNKHLVPTGTVPRSVSDLASPAFRNRACMANPLFGTTSMHAAALAQSLGEDGTRSFFQSLSSNGVALLSSNGEVKRRVAAGDYAIGLTDSDDVSVAIKDGKPVGWVIPDQTTVGALLIPNAVCLIAGGPNPENGRRFIDFLLSEEVETLLAQSTAVQIPLRENLSTPPFFPVPLAEMRLLAIDYSDLAVQMQTLTEGYIGQWTREQMEHGRKQTQ